MGISLDIRDNLFFKEAFAVGTEDGMQKGMRQGESAILTKLLERRFGPLPQWARERIEQADLIELEAIGLRLLDAARLEDVFNGAVNEVD